MKTGNLRYYFQCQNLLSALFILTLKFADRVIFCDHKFFWTPYFDIMAKTLHCTTHVCGWYECV